MDVWLNNAEAETVRFGALLDNDLTKEAFDEEWFKGLATRVENERKDLAKVILTSLVPTGYLALALLNFKPKESLFGLEVKHVFELALLATCFLGVYGALIAISRAQSYRLMRIWSEKTHGVEAKATHLSAFYSPLFALPKIVDPPVELATPTAASKMMHMLASASVGGAASLVGVATFGIQIWSICHLYALSGRVAIATAVLATLMTVLNFVVLYPLFGIRRPYKPTSPNSAWPRINVLPPEP